MIGTGELTEQIQAQIRDKNLEDYIIDPENSNTFVEHVSSALSLSGIRDNFNTEMLETGSSDEGAQMPEGNWIIPDTAGEDFEIPEKIYNTLPSVLEGIEPSGISDWIDFQDLSALNSFYEAKSFLSGITQAGPRLVENVLLNDYIMDTFESSMEVGRYFTGEIEYILGGHASFKENEDYVKQKLFFLRFVLNLTHVLGDDAKRGLAQEIGCAIALATSGGIGGDLYAVLIMCTWAACESGVDISDLFSGEAVPLIKRKRTWRTSIEGLLEREEVEGWETDSILDFSYEDYLMILLMMENMVGKTLLSIKVCLLIYSGYIHQ